MTSNWPLTSQGQRSRMYILLLLPPNTKLKFVWWSAKISRRKFFGHYHTKKKSVKGMLRTNALGLFSISTHLHYVVGTYMMIKWHMDGICISMQFVTDFRPHWPKIRSLYWPLINYQWGHIEMLTTSKILIVMLQFFQNHGILHCQVWQEHGFL